MRDTKLAELNFRTLLHYNSAPDLGAPSFPISCTGFCVSCEKNGFLDNGDHRLDQMSHGADTEDFEKLMGRLPPVGLEIPVAFLLESPGGYYGNGEKHTYEGIIKRPPVNIYYWTPLEQKTWPIEPSEVNPKWYGPYFAYIIAKHKLHNAYFTNIIKCSLAERDADQFVRYYVVRDPDNRDSNIRNNCYDAFLSKELAWPPKIGHSGMVVERLNNRADDHEEETQH
jgi:hypothetical protein